MFFILKSNLVNPFEPLDSNIRQELNQAINSVAVNSLSDNPLLDVEQYITLNLIAQSDSVLCGAPWVDRILEQSYLDGHIEWYVAEGTYIFAGDKICTIYGKVKNILGKEQIIIDYLILLSSIASYIRAYTELLSHSSAILYCDYMKISGLEFSQQYAVSVGGGQGYNASDIGEYLITSDYIHLSGGINKAIKLALDRYSLSILKVEVDSLQELLEALKLGINKIKLCYFTLEQLVEVQKIVTAGVEFEIYGGVYLGNVQQIAKLGINKIVLDRFGNQLPVVRYSYSYIIS